MTEHLSDLELDALRLGAADPAVEKHLGGCSRCRARQEALQASADAFAETFDPAALAAAALEAASSGAAPTGPSGSGSGQSGLRTTRPTPGGSGEATPSQGRPAPSLAVIDGAGAAPSSADAKEARPATRRPSRMSRWAAGSAVAMACAAAVLLAVRPAPDEVRAKGSGAAVELFVLADGTPTPASGPVDPRATLALRVTAEGPRYARLLWSEGEGPWQPLHPAPVAAAWKVEGPTWLERRIELDGAPVGERLGAVLCEAPVSHARALALLEGASEAGCEVEQLRVEKVTE